MPSVPQPFDEARFSEQLENHQTMMLQFLTSLTGSRHLADDVLQETNAILWKKRTAFEPGTNFKAWAFQTAFFQAKNHLRREARRGRREVVSDQLLEKIAAPQLSPAPDSDERRGALLRCLAKLREEHRQLVLRRYYGRTELADLATELGTSANALAQKLHRIRAKLLTCIRAELGADS